MVCRMFNSKLAELKEDVLKRKVLGRVVAHSYVIEFQKRGLPHVHMVLWLHDQDAPKKPEDVDRCVITLKMFIFTLTHLNFFSLLQVCHSRNSGQRDIAFPSRAGEDPHGSRSLQGRPDWFGWTSMLEAQTRWEDIKL